MCETSSALGWAALGFVSFPLLGLLVLAAMHVRDSYRESRRFHAAIAAWRERLGEFASAPRPPPRRWSRRWWLALVDPSAADRLG